MLMTIEKGRSIIAYNRNVLYHIPLKYKYLNMYLQGSLRKTLFSIYKFIYDKQILIIWDEYMFFASNTTLTNKVMKKTLAESTTSRHVNLLCALGLINKVYQNKHSGMLININKDFIKDNPEANPINVYSFRKYDDKELNQIEERAMRLFRANVTIGNFSQDVLNCNGLFDLRRNSFNYYSRNHIDLMSIFTDITSVIDIDIENHGYSERDSILNKLNLSQSKANKIYYALKNEFDVRYDYKRPTKSQIDEFGLADFRHIYTLKSLDNKEN